MRRATTPDPSAILSYVSERRFVVAKNPDPDSTLPFLVRLPIGTDGLVLKARET